MTRPFLSGEDRGPQRPTRRSSGDDAPLPPPRFDVRAFLGRAPWPSRAALFAGLVTVTLGILITVPALMAFTAQIVNLEARIVHVPLIQKVRTVENPDDPIDPVPVNTEVTWLFTITVTNTTGVPMENVVVVDRFGAELLGSLDPTVHNVEVLVRAQTRGSSGKASFDSQPPSPSSGTRS